MRLKSEEKIYALKELVYFLGQGEDFNLLDILSVFGTNIKALINFVKANSQRFSNEEKEVLLKFLEDNLKTKNENSRKPESNRENLTEVYSVIDPETKMIKFRTTNEDAKYVYDALYDLLKDKNIKIHSELIYLGLKRYVNYPGYSLFIFRDYIETKIVEKRAKKRKH